MVNIIITELFLTILKVFSFDKVLSPTAPGSKTESTNFRVVSIQPMNSLPADGLWVKFGLSCDRFGVKIQVKL